MSVDAEAHGWGKRRHIRTTLRVGDLGKVPHDLSMTPENLVNKLGKLIGGQEDIQTSPRHAARAGERGFKGRLGCRPDPARR